MKLKSRNKLFQNFEDKISFSNKKNINKKQKKKLRENNNTYPYWNKKNLNIKKKDNEEVFCEIINFL